MRTNSKVTRCPQICILLIYLFSTASQESAKAAAPGSFRLGVTTGNQAASSQILNPGDEVELKVYREDDLNTKTKLDKDGTIALPLIGEVKIGGLTIKKARELITLLYEKDYLVNPQITLTHKRDEMAGGTFTVLGRVFEPGSFRMPKGKEKIGLLEAIAMSGGFNRYANMNSVKVKRGEKVFEINAKKLADDPDTPPFYILPGDSINVPERRF